MSVAMAIAGVPANRMTTPADRREFAITVRDLYAANRAFAFVGGGTELELGNPPRDLDTVVRTTGLNRVIEYSPEDQTITVEAGMRFSDLDALLAKHKQFLPIDVVDRKAATVGGAIATNAFGSRRHRYGSIKDLIVGIEVVRPDGVSARGGGKVVKNVAGFDVPKLFVGSLGSLGAIVAATFRVFPSPEIQSAVACTGATNLTAFTRTCLDDAALEASSVTSYSEKSRTAVVITFAGVRASVDAQLRRLHEHAAAHGDVRVAVLDALEVAPYDVLESQVRASGAWRWTSTSAPAGDAFVRAEPFETHVSIGYPSFGVRLSSAADPRAGIAADAIAATRAALAGGTDSGRSFVVRAMPERFRAEIDAWGTPPPAFALMRALKKNFDPKGLCNPGRFVGGL